jgi:Ca-activated chloride channel family protein
MKQKSEEATESISEVTVEAVDAAKPLPNGVSYELQPEDIMLNQKEVDYNTEQYDHIQENEFKSAKQEPLSTFSIDVDKASYANVRRFITDNQLPPAGAVRIEELVNYFDYKYPQPATQPFSINTEYGTCPWNKEHQLVLIGLQGKDFKQENTPPFNLTFLLDVSGSMDEANKLPLVKESMKLLIDKMRDEDCMSIVVYAGSSGLVLKPTNGKNKEKIYEALDNLQAGGSTAGGEGIQLAYKTARENYAKNKINRVILATDGDFNIGVSSDDALVRLIEKERTSGVFLTVLGFGTGNYKDAKMKKLADKGNGNYAYIDNLLEAKKSLVKEMGGTLQTIAKDVKIQVEFNPAKVKGYRLVGYENRLLNNEDFNDDTKDAGELGAGHTVTALYEIIPAGSKEEISKTDALKYQKKDIQLSALNTDELMTVKFRYKLPNEDNSILLQHIVKTKTLNAAITNNFQWASTVAQFGMLLRDSKFKGSSNYKNLLAQAKAYKSNDEEGYRAEMIQLIEKAEMLKR